MKINGNGVILERGDNIGNIHMNGCQVLLDSESGPNTQPEWLELLEAMDIEMSGCSITGCTLSTTGVMAKKKATSAIRLAQFRSAPSTFLPPSTSEQKEDGDDRAT